MLKAKGAKIKKISIPLLKFSLPFHFTLCPAEASSNLARFDGLKYGHQPPFPEKGSEDDLTSYME
jgi:aspartyl-tRNA(Asn)/glutamyl-tRNA(Gln) amidotransferase subunit A